MVFDVREMNFSLDFKHSAVYINIYVGQTLNWSNTTLASETPLMTVIWMNFPRNTMKSTTCDAKVFDEWHIPTTQATQLYLSFQCSLWRM